MAFVHKAGTATAGDDMLVLRRQPPGSRYICARAYTSTTLSLCDAEEGTSLGIPHELRAGTTALGASALMLGVTPLRWDVAPRSIVCHGRERALERKRTRG